MTLLLVLFELCCGPDQQVIHFDDLESLQGIFEKSDGLR